MADPEDKKLNLKQIFMTSNNGSGTKTRIIPNTAQTIYLNQGSKLKPYNNQTGGKSKLNTNNKTNEDEEEPESESESGSESESDLDNGSEDEVDSNDDPVDEYENKEEEEEVVSEEEEVVSEEEEEEETIADTEYNEDGINEKDTEMNNEEEDNCLYQYDDLVEERDSEKQSYEIPVAERMTDPQITHYEKVRILGIRAKQIAMGSKVMVKYDNSIGPVELAKYELQHKTTPLIIKRPLPDNSYEMWKVSELNIDDDDSNIIKQNLEKSFAANKNNLYIISTV
jgi:DNA-directed RNA polymerase subunit K/omega